MPEKLHDEIFQGTSLSSLLKDIYDNSASKKKQITILVNELRPLIKDVSQAAMVVPLIKEYLEVAVKNDDQLVKMASVYQKFLAAEERIQLLQKEHGTLLTEEEKKQLLTDIDKDIVEMTEEIKNSEKQMDDTFEKMNAKNADVKKTIESTGELS